MNRLPVLPNPEGWPFEIHPSTFLCVGQDRGPSAALHLPVAPRCNLHCSYCDRTRDCANTTASVRSSRLLTPQQAAAFAADALASDPRIVCVGVSGPGEPLANPQATLETLRLVREQSPAVPLFVCTNGVQLEENVSALGDAGVSLCTVVVNSLDPTVVGRLIDWARGPEGILTGDDSARFVIERQVAGISAAIQAGMTARATCNLIPGVNDTGIEELAKRLKALGVGHLHLQPLRPSSARAQLFEGTREPTPVALEQAREAARRHLESIGDCHRCTWCVPDPVGSAAPSKGRGGSSDRLERFSKQKDGATDAASATRVEVRPGLAERGLALPQLQLIVKVARWLASSVDDTAGTLKQVLAWLDEELGLHRAVITLADASGQELTAEITHDVAPEHADRMRYRVDEGITGQVFTSGKSVLVPSLGAIPEFLDRSGLRANLDQTRLAFLCVPILDRDTTIGTLSADKDNNQLKDADSDLNMLEEVAQLLAPFVQRRRLEESLHLFRTLRSSGGPSARLIGRSSTMDEVRLLIAKVAPTPTTVLLTGETGTGKSAAAELLHELSPRAAEPFIEINCGALPDTLIESELFGHEKGAFTGAIQRRLGVFERARGGTVFLDEVGELGPSAQTRLLRVLQTKRFERVGGAETLTTNARLIAATNRDLSTAVATGEFRADLFYRLNVFPVCMPPLRERGNADIMLLADSFVDRHGRAMDKAIFRIDTPAIDMLTAYHWPGNVRELENVIERAVVLAEGEVIHGHHLPPSLQMNRYSAVPEQLDFSTRVAAFETELITEALKEANGNQTKAAERLGITKRVIQYKIRGYGIPWERFLPKP